MAEHEFDVVIVGAGGAGMRAALESSQNARTAVLTPCPRHTRIEGDPFCPACGTAHGSLDGFFWMPRSLVDDAEVVSRHPHGAAMLFFSPRAYALLAEVPGVRGGDPVRVCDD